MTIPALPPTPKSDNWQEWARELRDYLLIERSKVGAATPTTPILRHKMGEESAASDGVLMFEPTDKRLQVSVDGAWENVTIDADLGTIASQDANNVAITGGNMSGIYYGGRFRLNPEGDNYPIVIKPDSGDKMMVSLETDGEWGFINSNDNGSAISALINDAGASMSSSRSVVTREKGDNRYVMQSSIGTTVQAYSATLSDIKDEDDMSSNSATALATQQSIKAYVDAKTIGGASWTVRAETSTTRVGNTVYQNTNGNPMLVVLTCRSSGSAGQFQLSSNNSTWLSISEVPPSTEQERCIVCVVPDNWYYKTTVTLDTATDRWVEFK